MANIINFNEAKENNNLHLTEKDIFNIFMIYQFRNKDYTDVDLNVLMESLGKYINMERFYEIYRNITPIINASGKTIIDLTDVYKEYIDNRMIIKIPNQEQTFFVIAPEDVLNNLEKEYNDDVFYLFDSLMFYVSQDLEYGIDGWELIAEDEYIKIPNYPGIVTGEFIGKKRDKNFYNKVKKLAIEKVKREYE